MVTCHVGVALIELFSKYEGFLQKIYIINPNFCYTMVSMIWPLLNKKCGTILFTTKKYLFYAKKIRRIIYNVI